MSDFPSTPSPRREAILKMLPWPALMLALLPAHAQNQLPVPDDSLSKGQRVWELRLSDLRLDRALQRWAHEAGYSIRWDADRYVVIGANTRFAGTLEDAVQAVLSTPGIRASAYPLEACVYGNQPPLIRITRLGDQTEECL